MIFSLHILVVPSLILQNQLILLLIKVLLFVVSSKQCLNNEWPHIICLLIFFWLVIACVCVFFFKLRFYNCMWTFSNIFMTVIAFYVHILSLPFYLLLLLLFLFLQENLFMVQCHSNIYDIYNKINQQNQIKSCCLSLIILNL